MGIIVPNPEHKGESERDKGEGEGGKGRRESYHVEQQSTSSWAGWV